MSSSFFLSFFSVLSSAEGINFRCALVPLSRDGLARGSIVWVLTVFLSDIGVSVVT